MPLKLAAAIVLGAISFSARAAEPTKLDVWPGNAPGVQGDTVPEKWEATSKVPDAKPNKVSNVTHPTLTVFHPDADKDTGVAVIVCPGGGYKMLMMDYEGEDCARWLNSVGVTGIVLKYRVPAPEGQPKHGPALQDAQRTISLVRSKAAEWHLKPDHIGILGFSAGGHLSAAASTNFDKRSYEAVDTADQVSCRPDFAVLIYPGGVLQKKDPAAAAAAAPVDGDAQSFTGALAPEIRVTDHTPQAFLVMANEDRVNSENCIFYYLALKQAKVPAEMHIYAAGAHGFGMRPGKLPANDWPKRCEEWMRTQKILPAQDGAAAATK